MSAKSRHHVSVGYCCCYFLSNPVGQDLVRVRGRESWGDLQGVGGGVYSPPPRAGAWLGEGHAASRGLVGQV